MRNNEDSETHFLWQKKNSLRKSVSTMAWSGCRERVKMNLWVNFLYLQHFQSRRQALLPQNSVLGTYFFFGIRDIVPDFWKYQFLVLGTLSLIILGTMSLIPKFFSVITGIYIQFGIDWNHFTAGKRIDYD